MGFEVGMLVNGFEFDITSSKGFHSHAYIELNSTHQ